MLAVQDVVQSSNVESLHLSEEHYKPWELLVTRACLQKFEESGGKQSDVFDVIAFSRSAGDRHLSDESGFLRSHGHQADYWRSNKARNDEIALVPLSALLISLKGIPPQSTLLWGTVERAQNRCTACSDYCKNWLSVRVGRRIISLHDSVFKNCCCQLPKYQPYIPSD